MRPLLRTTALAALLLSGGAALAQAPAPGQLLASNCFQCHGTNGKGPGFDRLAGKSSAEIYEELLDMRASGNTNDLMVKHSLIYTDAQLRLIAAFFVAQPARLTR